MDGKACKHDYLICEPCAYDAGRLAALREVLAILEDIPELNVVNYNHDDVCELNAAASNAYLAVKAMIAKEEGR